MKMQNVTATKFYSITLIHPQLGIRNLETLATSLKEAEEITAKQWGTTQWKVDFRA